MPVETREMILSRQSLELQTSIEGFHPALAQYLEGLGLPTEAVLAPNAQRAHVITSLASVLEFLPIEAREKSFYLSKFTVAIAAGLFDGALNYLWNETISALRRLVFEFDLQYFFAIAQDVDSRNTKLSAEEDLNRVGDHDLLEACRRIGFLTEVNYQRLNHINYMRNHASAAHPTTHGVDGFEIVAWLSNCLQYAITAKPDHSVIAIKKLLINVRTEVIPQDDFAVIGIDIAKQPQERVDDLLSTLFGMYTDPKVIATAKSNITQLGPYIWAATSEDKKYEIGSRFGTFRKNAEVARKDLAQEFLTTVDGLKYKDEDSLAGELIEKLTVLNRVHHAFNNFYNEYPHAKALAESLPPSAVVPRPSRPLWVKVLATCFVGNGFGIREGVDESALPYYKLFIDRFTEAETIEFIHLMTDPEFTGVLSSTIPDRRVRQLASLLKPRHPNVHIQRALDMIVTLPGKNIDNIGVTGEYKRVLQSLPKPA